MNIREWITNKMKKIAIYPGSFDPLTEGHLDIINRSLNICDELIVAIGINQDKKTMFSLEDRLQMIQDTLDEHVRSLRVTTASFNGLLVDFAMKVNARTIVRGVRSSSDFEYEMNLASINRKIMQVPIDTIFFPTKPELAIVSSSMVKELMKFNQDITQFVPPAVRGQILKMTPAVDGRTPRLTLS